MMKMRLLVTCALLLTATGCATNRSVRGWIPDQETDKSQRDFMFMDDQGKVGSFRDLRGDYTVLAFTRCDKDTHDSVAGILEAIVDENRLGSSVKVVGIDVHWSEKACNHGDMCHVVSKRADLASLCDTTGAIRSLYASGRDDRLVVIGPRGKVILSSPVQDADELSQLLQARVTRLSNIRREELYHEYKELAAGDR